MIDVPRSHDDAGFTLTELLAVVGLMGVVIAAAWGGMYVVAKSNAQTTAQSNAAHSFADPMEEISKMLMQNLSVSSTDPYRVEVWTDRNMDGQPELDAFYAASGQLVYERWGYNSARTVVLNHYKWVMSPANGNNYGGTMVPLFTYYDANGVQITDMTKAPSGTRLVRVRVVVRLGNGATTSDTRDVVFRNRS